jgi:hypothetical protein
MKKAIDAQIEELQFEKQYLTDLVSFAYYKLYPMTFSNIEDALMMDRMKLWLEHEITA